MASSNKISFIVTGMNHEKTIKMCIDSIIKSVYYLNLYNYEIIYVDLQSIDNTLKIVKKEFRKMVTVHILENRINAANARNTAARLATGNVYFFIDGDMEILPEFLKNVYDEEGGLKCDFVSGKLRGIIYNKNWERVGIRQERYSVKETTKCVTAGGVFLIKSDLFNSVKGFRTKYRKNEGLDFGLRLSKKGSYLVRIPATIANYHTNERYNKLSSILKRIIKGDQLYSGVLFRDHMLNLNYLKIFLKREKFTFILLFTTLLAYVINPFFLFLYPLMVFLKHLISPINNYFERLLGRVSDSVMLIAGILFFYPSDMDRPHF